MRIYQATSSNFRLVGDDANSATSHAGKSDKNVLGVVGHELEEVVLIDSGTDDVLHVVGGSRVQWH